MYRSILLLGIAACEPGAGVYVDGPGADSSSLPGANQPGADPGAPEDPMAMSGFSFVEDGVAGLPQPGRYAPLDDDLQYLQDQGIGLLVSLTVIPTAPDSVANHGMGLLHIPIEDFQAPSAEQQDLFVAALQTEVAAGGKGAVHCTAGLGRTGTMLATWFVAQGDDAQQAIDRIRTLRPGSIETADQEQSVFRFADGLP